MNILYYRYVSILTFSLKPKVMMKMEFKNNIMFPANAPTKGVFVVRGTSGHWAKSFGSVRLVKIKHFSHQKILKIIRKLYIVVISVNKTILEVVKGMEAYQYIELMIKYGVGSL